MATPFTLLFQSGQVGDSKSGKQDVFIKAVSRKVKRLVTH